MKMKALIRNTGETVLETAGVEGIDWQTGAPLTNAAWCGGPYQLVQNYVPPVEDVPESYEAVDVAPGQDAMPAPEEAESYIEDDTIVINGVRYTKEQLRQMLGE